MGGVVDAVVDIGKSIVKVVSKVITSVVSVFSSPFGTSFDAPDVNVNDAYGIQGVLVNKDSAISNIPIVYGTRMVGGTRVFVSTNGTNNQYLYVAVVLSEGQCNGYSSLLIDDTTVPLSSYAHGVQATPSSGNFQNKLVVQFFDGRDNQVSSSLLQEAPGWTSNHKLSGLCYVALRYEWLPPNPTQEQVDNNPYSGNIPTVKLLLQGKKIYDATAGYSAPTVGTITSTTGTWNDLLAEDTFVYQNINRTDEVGDYLYPTLANQYTDNIVFFTLNITADVIIKSGATLELRNPLVFDGQAVSKKAAYIEKWNGSSWTSVNSMSLNFYVNSGRNQDGLDPTTRRIREETLTLNLSSGDYRVRFARNQIDNFNNQYYTANFSGSVQIVIPEITGDHTTAYADESVTFSNNPVNVLLDYLRNPRYGKGLDNDAFNWSSFYNAATLCDQVVNYTDSTTGKAFTCDAVIDTSSSLMDNVKTILQGFRGILPYQQGQYQLKIEHGGDDTDINGTPTAPPVVYTFTNDDIVGGVSIQGENKESKLNRCRVTYVDPDSDYQPNEVIWPEDGSSEDTAYLGQDAVRLEKNITLNTVAHREQAIQYAEVYVKRTRSGKVLTFSTTIAAANVSVGDLIRVINEKIGLDGYFRVLELKISATGDIVITAYEHQSTIYGFIAKAYDIVRPTINLPDPLQVDPITGLSLASGSAYNFVTNNSGYLVTDSTVVRLYVSWTASADPYADRYVIQYKLSSDSVWTTVSTTVNTEFYINGVVVGQNYDVRVAVLNSLQRRSDWVTVSGHTISA